jgi:hypothetical protein
MFHLSSLSFDITETGSGRNIDPWVMVCVDLVGPFTIKTTLKTHSLLALTIIDPATGWFEITKANNKSACSITPGLRNIRDLNVLSLTVEANSNVSLCKCATTMALLPNQLLVITLKQTRSWRESTKWSMKCSDHLIMRRSI